MTRYEKIEKTEHYKICHEKDFPFEEVCRIVLSAKSLRKKENKIVLITDQYYILCELKEKILYVINAKRK
ncbi:MAG: hypothetical protein Q8O89_07555 [Nanoarchaeota archaeon]|nr:hypothetical protein [Nanoarchaeota archaeon]